MLLRYCCFSSHLDVVEEKSDYRDLNRGPKCSQPKTLKPLLCRCPVVVGCRVPLQYPLISDNVSSLRCAYGRRTFARRFRVRLREFGICGFVVSTRGEASAACCQTRAETLREIFDVAVSSGGLRTFLSLLGSAMLTSKLAVQHRLS